MKKILIVDDEKDVLMVLEKRLTAAGYEVVKANNGKDAIIIAKRERPDLILLDIAMPEMSGGEAAKILKSDPDTKDITIIFLTALLEKIDKEGERLIGGMQFIAKPYKPEELLEIIRKNIGQ
jgi:CheY-like chemotaxis protein